MSNDNCVGCLTGYEVGVASDGIARAHPDCPEHGLHANQAEYFPVGLVSSLTGAKHYMRFPEELRVAIEAYLSLDPPNRPFVQEAFPTMDPDHREFLMTGITPDEWMAVMGNGEEG